MGRRSASRLVVLAVLLLSLNACAASSPASSPSTAASPTGSSAAGLQAVTAGPLPSVVPSLFAHEATHPDPAFDMGYVVQITTAGFHPNQLVVPFGQPVIFENLTNQPNQIEFIALKVKVGPVPPGGSALYSPLHPVTLAYQSLSYPSMSGSLLVTPTSE